MEEEKIVIYCPICKKGTKIKKEGSPMRTVKCCNKECAYTNSLIQFQREEQGISGSVAPVSTSQAAATVFLPQGADIPSQNGSTMINRPMSIAPGATVFETQPVRAKPAIGSLQVIANGQKYKLASGTNIIGRQHPSSQATIQIATDDGYMSRQHMRIDVFPSGSGFQYRISDNNSKNSLTLNGSVLGSGDVVMLNPGDRITIGRTNLVFMTI